MATGPYSVVRQVSAQPQWPIPLGQPQAHLVQVEAVDTMNVSAQEERLIVQTLLSPPYPNHPQGLELEALIRARDLLDAQIQAMQSP